MPKIFTVICLIFVFSSISFGQTQERMVDWRVEGEPRTLAGKKNEPMMPTKLKGLELIEVKYNGNSIVLGKAFVADENWLKNLTVKVRNVLKQTIKSIRIGFSIPETGIGIALEYGQNFSTQGKKIDEKSLLPNEELELFWDDAHYKRDQEFIARKTGITNVEKVQINGITVLFEDETFWLASKLQIAHQNQSK